MRGELNYAEDGGFTRQGCCEGAKSRPVNLRVQGSGRERCPEQGGRFMPPSLLMVG